MAQRDKQNDSEKLSDLNASFKKEAGNFMARIETIREKIKKLKRAETDWLARPVTEAEFLDAVLKDIQSEAADSKRYMLASRNVAEIFPRDHLVPHFGSSPLDIASLKSLVFFALGDLLLERLKELYRDNPLADAVTKDQREAKLREIREQMFELETQGEAMACELERYGIKTMRQPDLSPEIFLEWQED